MLIDVKILNKDGARYDIALIYPQLSNVKFSWFSTEVDYRISSSAKESSRFYSYIDIYNYETVLAYIDWATKEKISEYTYTNISENSFNRLKEAIKYFNDNYEIINGYFKHKESKNIINIVEKNKTYMIEIDPSILMTPHGHVILAQYNIHSYTTFLHRRNSLKIYNNNAYLDIYNFKPFKSFIKKKNISKETINKLKMLNFKIMLYTYKSTENIKEI